MSRLNYYVVGYTVIMKDHSKQTERECSIEFKERVHLLKDKRNSRRGVIQKRAI